MSDYAQGTSNQPATLLEAWQLRREQLAAADDNIQPFKRELIHVLDYVINRYGAEPEGKQPPRSVIPSDLMLNQRVILVHSFLGRRDYACIKSKAEATSRVARVLGRLKSLELHESAQAPAAGSPLVEPGALQPQEAARTVGRGIRSTVENLFPSLFWARSLRARLRDNNGLLFDEDVEFLGNHVKRNASIPAMEILMQCANPAALDYAVAAWQERVQQRYRDALSYMLHTFFHLPARKQAAAETFRAQLAHVDTEVRIQAAHMLSTLGDLQDVTLLTALLSLPDVTDKRERRVLLHVLHQISGAKPLEPDKILTKPGATAMEPAPTGETLSSNKPRPVLGEITVWQAVDKDSTAPMFAPKDVWVLRRPIFAALTITALSPLAALLLIWAYLDSAVGVDRLLYTWGVWLLPLVMLAMSWLARISNPHCTALLFYPRRLWVAMYGALAILYVATTVWLLFAFASEEVPDYFFLQRAESAGAMQFMLPLLPVAAIAAYILTQAVQLAMAQYVNAAAWRMNANNQ